MDAGDWIAAISALVAVAALSASYLTFRLTRTHLLYERVHRLTDRLYEIDRHILECPRMQRILYEESDRRTPYFVQDTPHDDAYFQVKTFVYTQINLFDEIFSVVEGNRRLEKAFEFSTWKDYMIRRLRHPLFRELLDGEGSIWGNKFREFIDSNRHALFEPMDKEMY